MPRRTTWGRRSVGQNLGRSDTRDRCARIARDVAKRAMHRLIAFARKHERLSRVALMNIHRDESVAIVVVHERRECDDRWTTNGRTTSTRNHSSCPSPHGCPVPIDRSMTSSSRDPRRARVAIAFGRHSDAHARVDRKTHTRARTRTTVKRMTMIGVAPSASSMRALRATRRGTKGARARASRGVARAGLVEDVQRAIAESKKVNEERERGKRSAPPGVPPPPIVPEITPATFGFVDNAERMNSRASMVGWWSLLAVEGIAHQGLLEIMGVQVGKGINFTF